MPVLNTNTVAPNVCFVARPRTTSGPPLAALFGLLALIFIGWGGTVRAQSNLDYYRGKTIDMVISSSAGGGNDAYSRLVARSLSNHIPGHPNVVPRNMPGAGGLVAGNYLYNIAPQDGTVIGQIQDIVPLQPLLGVNTAKYDALKFNYIGSANFDISIIFVWATSHVKTFNDLLTGPSIMAGSNGSLTSLYCNAINQLLGGQITQISGYPGVAQAFLAVERGEADGYPAASWSTLKSTRPDWLAQGKIHLLVQLSPKKSPDLPDVPPITDFLQTDVQRQAFQLILTPELLGRLFVAPPNVPADRMAMLRKAFDETMKDPQLISDAEKEHLEVRPTSGEAILDLVRQAYATPKAIVDLVDRANTGN
jgi:tripartite-type tricarboxylate transporter receptor subunit TctC